MRIRSTTLKCSGVIQGVGDNALSPKTFATRARMTAKRMRHRLLRML